MKCSILVLCLALAVANGQLSSILSSWVDANKNLMVTGVDMGTGAGKGLAGMKQGAVNTLTGAGRGGVNMAQDVASTMVGANLGAVAQLADRNVPIVGGMMSGAINMVNSMEQMKIKGIAQAMKMPLRVMEAVVGLEVGAFNKMLDAANSFMKLNLEIGAGAMQTMISLASGMTNMSGQMGRVAQIMMRNMPGKIMSLAMNIRKDILPSMRKIVEDLKHAGEEIYNNIKSEVDGVVAKMTSPEFKAKLAKMKSAMQDMVEGVSGSVNKVMEIASEMGLPASQVATVRGVLESMSIAFGEVKELREAVTKGMEHVHDVVENMRTNLNSKEFQELTKQMNDFIPLLLNGDANVSEFVDKVVAAIPSLEARKADLTAALEKLETVAVKVKEQLKTVMDKVNKLMPSLGDMMKQLRANMEEAMKTLGGAAGMAGGMAGGLAGGMAGGLSGGMSGGMSAGMSAGLSGGMSGNTAGLVNNAAAMAGNAANIAGSALAMGGNAVGMASNVAGLAGGAARGVVGGISRFSVWG